MTEIDQTITTTILSSMHDGVLVVNFSGRFVYANRSALELFCLSEQEVTERSYSDLFMSESRNDAFNDILFSGIQNHEIQVYCEVPFRRSDGKVLELAVTTSFLRNEDRAGQGEGIVVVFKDITETKALDRARQRVLDHMSHELSTPLAIIKATLKRVVSPENSEFGERIEHNLKRLEEIQRAVSDIVNSKTIREDANLGVWLRQVQDLFDMAAEEKEDYAPALGAVKRVISRLFGEGYSRPQSVDLAEEAVKAIDQGRESAGHRQISLCTKVESCSRVWVDPEALNKALITLIKNAIEATPDGGEVAVSLMPADGRVVFEVRDSGVGITSESQDQIFGGFYHALETDLYSTKKPYDFGAGGKGLELLRLKVFAEIYHFEVKYESRRCIYIPEESQLCPGSIASCPHVKDWAECAGTGGTTFRLTFRNEESL